jgi:hypothetical protein
VNTANVQAPVQVDLANATAVQDDGVSDHLDWYFAILGDEIDRLRSGEVVTTIS